MPDCENLRFSPRRLLIVSSFVPLTDGGDEEKRTADQWIRSILIYLEFRAGTAWRNLSRAEQRRNPQYIEYLEAARLVLSVRYAEPRKPQLVLKDETRPKADSRAKRLEALPRNVLFDRLCLLDQTLTDKRLLSHLPRPKLAAMLAERERQAKQKHKAIA